MKSKKGSDPFFEVEIGSGRGNYLVQRAQENPDRNFIGVEWKTKLVELARLRAERMKLENVQFVDADAREAVSCFPPESVSVFHIYFPDPWVKRKHLRRRLITRDFLSELAKPLKPGGLVEIATDSREYFEKIKKEINSADVQWNTVRESVGERLFSPAVKTLFESKYAAKGKELYYLELTR